MSTHIFLYKDFTVMIVPEEGNFWFVINGRPITFVSNIDTAKRLAIRFVDVISEEEYKESKKNPMYKPRLNN